MTVDRLNKGKAEVSGQSSAQRVYAIVPVQSLDRAKSRFGDSAGRRDLAFAMAEATLEALTGWTALCGTICVTSDPEIRHLAIGFGCEVVEDPGEGLNAAFRAGKSRAEGFGATTLMLTHADFLGLEERTLDASFCEWRESGKPLGLVRSKDGAGTNAVFMHTDAEFDPCFGEDSFARHYQQGDCVEIGNPWLAHDIDCPADIPAALEEISAAPGAVRALAGFGVERDLLAMPIEDMTARARELRDHGSGDLVTYSPKVFLPLTELCRDVCHYCTFAKTPKRISAPYLPIEQMVETARAGAQLGCKEALFTLGDRPEDRYAAAREWLADHGYASTVDYLAHAAQVVRDETGLLPHINAGCLTGEELERLRPVAASMGLMLESTAPRLCNKGGPHHGSPDKLPESRLAVLEEAGRQRIPFTTGLLVGIGETRAERLETLQAIAALHRRFGHVQEVIVQNFQPKPGTRMADVAPPMAEEVEWTVAAARLILGPHMSIQAPPNLNPARLEALIQAGINDWGGVSPLTPDFVNPEAPWPEIEALAKVTQGTGKNLAPRLTIYPKYIMDVDRWIAPEMRRHVLELADGAGLARDDNWRAGRSTDVPRMAARGEKSVEVCDIIQRVHDAPTATDIAALFSARDADFRHICEVADDLRAKTTGDAATYVVNRNINYTNICSYRCTFCAFSKGDRKREGNERPYLLDLDEIGRRCGEAWDRGASEVCLQGGIHPSFTGETYLEIVRAVKRATPDMHVHAFSPLEVSHGATTLGMSLGSYLAMLRDEGLGSLPGTAAEILDDRVRRQICPDKLMTSEWMEVMRAAHGAGLRTTATVMFGHVDTHRDWAKHLLRIRQLQAETGGFTEFVPLPFVAHEAPMYRRGQARPGPTLREAILMHAVARIVLHGHIDNVQASWVKLGPEGMKLALQSGANDLGGTLMDESITRAAGAEHGQEMTVSDMETMALLLGRKLVRRTTLYGVHEMQAREYA